MNGDGWFLKRVMEQSELPVLVDLEGVADSKTVDSYYVARFATLEHFLSDPNGGPP